MTWFLPEPQSVAKSECSALDSLVSKLSLFDMFDYSVYSFWRKQKSDEHSCKHCKLRLVLLSWAEGHSGSAQGWAQCIQEIERESKLADIGWEDSLLYRSFYLSTSESICKQEDWAQQQIVFHPNCIKLITRKNDSFPWETIKTFCD